MLVFMECIGVSQRINNMQRLRDMAGDSTNVQVFRSNNWREIDSRALLPGDIVRVAAGPFSIACPKPIICNSRHAHLQARCLLTSSS